MVYSRRRFFLFTGALALSACGSPVPVVHAQTELPEDMRPVRSPAFLDWVARFRQRALARGISGNIYDAAFAQAGFLPGVVERDRTQIQTRRTLDEYLSIAASDERIANGRAAIARHDTTLRAIEARYGVSRYIIAAIWGMESRFGERRGQIPVVSSTATLAFDGRRAALFEGQLLDALEILQNGDTTANGLLGSWAGAMGHTQFMPSAFKSFAVDFNGDGKRDIWSDDPTDALASAANYLSRNGWRSGLTWGGETGVTEATGRQLQPQAGGVTFTVTRNFNVIKTYNNSDFYALGIGHLSDRLRGVGPLRGSFPPDSNGLTRQDRIAVQRGLQAQGYDVGTIDGVIGSLTENAISDFQRRNGLNVTGVATRELLARLR